MVSISEDSHGGLEATAQTDLEGRSHRKEHLGLKCKDILMTQGPKSGCLLCKASTEYLSRGKKAYAIAKTPLAP